MTGKLLLFLGAERLAAYLWQNGQLLEEHTFTDDQAGRELFAELLRKNGNAPVCLLTDVVEEDFRFETVPHVMGRDRALLLNRKLEQFYRSTPLRHAEIQYRLEEGRRDDRVLFSGLTNPGQISTWLEELLRLGVPLAGIYSVPLISRRLIDDIPSSYVLLITWQKHGGLRQTYFKDGHLSFSRLTPMAGDEGLLEKVLTESARTHKYLNSLSLLPTDHPLDICILCDGGDKQELHAALKNTPSLRYLFRDTGEAAQRIGLKTSARGSDCTPLLMHLLAGHAIPNQYGNADHTHFFTLWQIRRSLRVMAALLLAVCAGWSGFNIWQGFQRFQSAQQIKAMTESLAGQHRSILQSFPKTPVPAERMKAAVSTIAKLSASSPPPQQFLSVISRALEGFPMVLVNNLSWQATFTPEAVKSPGLEQALADKAVPGAPVAAAVPGTPYEVIFLGGEIVPFNGNYREALDNVDRFQQALSQAGMTVTPVALPLDLRPQASLSSDIEERADRAGRATFTLRILWKAPL